MATGKVTTQSGDVIEIDFSEMEKRIEANLRKSLESLTAKVAESYKTPKHGKGIVEAMNGNERGRVVEYFENLQSPGGRTKEQWTIVVPVATQYEIAGHLRDYVFVTDVVKGKQGETVNIPYVKDLEFEDVSPKGAFSGTTDLISTTTTTLNEAGTYSDIYYGDIEKIDSNLLDELNRVFAAAAVRSEDRDLMKLLDAGTTSQFGGADGYCDVGDLSLALVDTHFKAEWIADAIGEMLKKGKAVNPGDLLLWMTPVAYQSLLKEMISSQVFAYARGDIVSKGLIENLLGVKIVVGGYETRSTSGVGIGGGGTSYEVCYLMRPKRCLALAPKRDILIETDRLVKTRQLTIAGSHTYGVVALDITEAVRIWTGQPATAT